MTDSIVLYGSGGNARVIIDMLRQEGRFEIAGLIDDNPERHGQDVYGEPILGGREELQKIYAGGVRYAANAVGSSWNTTVRTQIYHHLVEIGFGMPPILHPSVIRGHAVTIGPGTLCMAGVILNPGARLGANVLVNTGTVIEHDCVLKDHVFVGPGCALAGNTVAEEGAFIGVGANTRQGIHLGAESLVAGGAMVIRDVEPGHWVGGVPAKVIRR